jgi:hypothetical protein
MVYCTNPDDFARSPPAEALELIGREIDGT